METNVGRKLERGTEGKRKKMGKKGGEEGVGKGKRYGRKGR
jgi:hypothetical protein